MSSITPGVNVPDRSIGEGSPVGGAGLEAGSIVSGSCMAVGSLNKRRREAGLKRRFPEVQIRPLEVPEPTAGDQLAEGCGGGDLPALEMALDEITVLRRERLLHGIGAELAGLAADVDGPGVHAIGD